MTLFNFFITGDGMRIDLLEEVEDLSWSIVDLLSDHLL